jgi:PAS domain S-box-containing protein
MDPMQEEIGGGATGVVESPEATALPLPMADLVSNFDWAATPLGPASQWPASLKTTVRILLTSRFSMWMAWGPKLTIIYNDSYAKTTLGRKHPWALGRPAAEVWSEIWKDIGPRIDHVMKSGKASWEEALMLILERSGYPEETYHTFSYSPLEADDGTIAGMLCVVIEDTTRVIGERQLGALSALAAELGGAISQKDVFSAIERGLSDQKDMPCTLTYLYDKNRERMNLVARTGMDLDDAAASAWHDAEAAQGAWPMREVLETNRSITVEVPESMPDMPAGCWDRPPSLARLIPITRQGADTPVGVFITALNPYREFDAFYGEFLDLIVGQIAAGISNAQAYEEEKKRAESLAELDRAKTAFFSNVSHELRTPLTLILGPIEDALTAQTPPTTQAIEMLHRNALRLLKLVNGLLDFVRIESGRMRARFEATDLSLLVAQLASVFRSAVERAGLQLVVDCPPLPEAVYVDREMWEKIELNLLSNALKSTFEGEVRVTVRAAEGSAQVTVSDTGTGISKDHLADLFQRFQRIEGARRRSHEGSGIGLALVHELVEMHGGSIAVESEVGRGTSFTITVPFGRNHLAAELVSGEEAKPVALQGAQVAYVQEALGWLPRLETGERLRENVAGDDGGRAADEGDTAAVKRPVIVFADDNADIREYVSDLLGWRFEVIETENGKQALEVIEQRVPDLILTDVMMPEMDGFGLLKAVRENQATRGVPVIMLSARAGEEARIEGSVAGADDYLTKPFTARELVARVEGQLKMARLRKDAAQQEAALSLEIAKARKFAWEALEHIPDAFAALDRDFRITYLNRAANQVMGPSGRSHIGECLWDLYPMLKGTAVERHFCRAMDEREPVEFEQYFEDGAEAWFKFLIYPQPGNGVIVYMRDTTNAQKAELALRGSEQLAAAGRLAASIAHEINNPLEAVTNLLFLAKLDESVGANTKSLLEVADRELQRLSHIAARSLKFYRQRTAPALTSVEELIEAVLFFNDPDLRSRKIQVERRHRAAPQVLCLPGEIQQVVTNLVSNALDALRLNGRLIVAVRPARDGKGRRGVSLTVADTGQGMSRATLDRLFQPFVTTKGESGNGLGLWVSKGILDKHRATIAVRSRVGGGTVFRVFVPLDTTDGRDLPS